MEIIPIMWRKIFPACCRIKILLGSDAQKRSKEKAPPLRHLAGDRLIKID
jgi:hypothetical protein